MVKKIFKLMIFLFIIFIHPSIVTAEVTMVSQSANLNFEVENIQNDQRVIILTDYLVSKNSPLAEHADLFIKYADENNIDWRLVPAISGVESSFGIHIPANSYNAYGWANGEYNFKSWEDSIQVVSKALNEKYYNKGATNINRIAKRYAPPSSTWAGKVKFFMKKIDPIPVEFDL
jgi:hypothetical protein